MSKISAEFKRGHPPTGPTPNAGVVGYKDQLHVADIQRRDALHHGDRAANK